LLLNDDNFVIVENALDGKVILCRDGLRDRHSDRGMGRRRDGEKGR
jgi:hypothetical protein